MTEIRSFINSHIDIIVAIIGVFFSITLCSYVILYYAELTKTLTARISPTIFFFFFFFILLVCLFWIFFGSKRFVQMNISDLEIETPALYKISDLFFYIFYTISILILFFRPSQFERPFLFFIILITISGIISISVFFRRKNKSIILLQIILLGIWISWTQQWIYPFLVGIDPWYHQFFTSEILNSGQIPEGYQYSSLPVFHLFLGITTLLSTLNYKFSAMVSAGFVQILCNTVFTYLIAKKMLNSSTIALLSALIVILSNYHIFMSYRSIPNGFGGVIIPMLIFILFFLTNPAPWQVFLITTLYTILAILTHDLIAIGTAIILVVIWISTGVLYYLQNENPDRIKLSLIPFLFSITLFGYWTYVSGRTDFLARLLKIKFDSSSFTHTPPDYASLFIVPLAEQLFNYAGLILFFSLSLIGSLYILSRKGSFYSHVYIFAGVTPLVISFFSLFLGYSIIEYRWLYIAQILMSVPCAVGIFAFARSFSDNLKVSITIIGLILTSIAFFAIFGVGANIDNTFFSPHSKFRASPIESEIVIQNFLGKIDGNIATDSFFGSILKYLTNKTTRDFSKEIIIVDFYGLKGNFILIRSDIVINSLMIYSDIYKVNYNIKKFIETQTFSKVYNNGNIFGYF